MPAPNKPLLLEDPDFLAGVMRLAETAGTDKMIAHAMGVHHTTFSDWKSKGRKDHDEGLSTTYSRFYLAFREARAKMRLRLVEKIEADPKMTWRLLSLHDEEFREPEPAAVAPSQTVIVIGGQTAAEAKTAWERMAEAPAIVVQAQPDKPELE